MLKSYTCDPSPGKWKKHATVGIITALYETRKQTSCLLIQFQSIEFLLIQKNSSKLDQEDPGQWS